MKGNLARKVLAGRGEVSIQEIRHLARGTEIEILRQRPDSQVEVRLADGGIWFVPADAIDADAARLGGIHRPPRKRMPSGTVRTWENDG